MCLGIFLKGNRIWEVEVSLHTFLTLALDRGEGFNITPLTAIPQGKNPDIYVIVGWMGSRTGLDALEKRNISFLYRDSTPDFSSQ
jgi:hypothetical protein